MVWTMTGQPVIGIKASKKNLGSVVFSPDSDLLATSGLGDNIDLWSFPAGEKVRALPGHEVAVLALNFILDGRYLVSLGYEQTIRVWETESWQEVSRLQPQSPSARGLAFSPDHKEMAVFAASMVEIWSTSSWQLEREIPIGTPAVNSVDFSADGKWLAVGAADRRIRLFAYD